MTHKTSSEKQFKGVDIERRISSQHNSSEAEVYAIVTNYNSLNYLSLAALSLYSIFRGVESLDSYSRIVLVDSASTDGSYEELVSLGLELSREVGIPFDYVRLGKDLGNSFALAYGFIRARMAGAKYVILIDNDFIITEPETLRYMVTVLKVLENKRKVYAVAPLLLNVERSEFFRKFGHIDINLENLRRIYEELKSIRFKGVLDSNFSYVDSFGRAAPIPNMLPLSVVEKVSEMLSKKKIFLSSYVASAIAAYNIKCAPIFPYTYILADDIISGLDHSKLGYASLVVPRLAGFHFAFSSSKISEKREYLKIRNTIWSNAAERASVVYLCALLELIYRAFINVPINIMFGSHILRFSPRGVRVRVKSPRVLAYSVLGAFHGTLNLRHVLKLRRLWLRKWMINRDVGENLLKYTRLTFSDWSYSMKLNLFLRYIFQGLWVTEPSREFKLLIKRLRHDDTTEYH